jgi:hypothetical protein
MFFEGYGSHRSSLVLCLPGNFEGRKTGSGADEVSPSVGETAEVKSSCVRPKGRT